MSLEEAKGIINHVSNVENFLKKVPVTKYYILSK